MRRDPLRSRGQPVLRQRQRLERRQHIVRDHGEPTRCRVGSQPAARHHRCSQRDLMPGAWGGCEGHGRGDWLRGSEMNSGEAWERPPRTSAGWSKRLAKCGDSPRHGAVRRPWG